MSYGILLVITFKQISIFPQYDKNIGKNTKIFVKIHDCSGLLVNFMKSLTLNVRKGGATESNLLKQGKSNQWLFWI